MSRIKNYFKHELQLQMLGFDHPNCSDFYIGCWQTTRSVVPLLVIRAILFLGSIAIVISSMVTYGQHAIFGFWFIYLTHWGLLIILITTGFAMAVSAHCYFYGPIRTEFNLPWHVKSYWVMYNIATPLALLITVFYWTILYEAGFSEEFNLGLDIAVHGLNSVVMLLLFLTASHPARLLHLYQPFLFALTYVLFGVIYYLAGGTDGSGNNYIYPVVNWSNPGPTVIAVVLTALLLILMDLLMVGLALARNATCSRLLKLKSPALNPREEVALQYQEQTPGPWQTV